MATVAGTTGDAGMLALDRGGGEVAAAASEEGVALRLLQESLPHCLNFFCGYVRALSFSDSLSLSLHLCVRRQVVRTGER